MSLQFGTANLFSATKADAKSIDVKTLPAPERQRGLWSFLTWSFFLANFLTMTDLFGQSAHAAAMPGGESDHSHSGADASFSGVSHPDMQHVSLETLPPDAMGNSAQPAGGMNPLSAAMLAHPEFGPMQLGFAGAQSGASVSAQGELPVSTSGQYENVSSPSDSHDGPGSTTATGPSSPPVTEITHDIITVVDTIIHDVAAPVTGAVDTVLQTVTTVVGDLGGVVNGVTSTVGDLLGKTLDVATPLTADVGHVIDGVTTSADTLIHTVADTVREAVPMVVSAVDNLGSDLGHTLNDTGSTLLHQATNLGGDVASITSPVVATLLDQDGPASSVLSSVTHDVLGSSLNGIGLSTSGSLAFSADTPDALGSHDAGSSATGYTQFHLAVSDVSIDAGASTSTDTGGITTIITSAIGIGSQAQHSDSGSGDHSTDHQPVHLSVLDDVQSHLHSSLFG